METELPRQVPATQPALQHRGWNCSPPANLDPALRNATERKHQRKRWWPTFAMLAIAAVAAFSSIPNLPFDASGESKHVVFQQQIEPLNRSYRETGQTVLRSLNAANVLVAASNVVVSDVDRDEQLTAAVRSALAKQANDGIVPAVAQSPKHASNGSAPMPNKVAHNPIAVQADPLAAASLSPALPQLSANMKSQLVSGNAEFYTVYLRDCCDEDGDIVEVCVDGVPLSVVPLTHQEVRVSIPVSSAGTSRISLRGVLDGGGGITVAWRTSQGTFFHRSIREGESLDIGIAR